MIVTLFLMFFCAKNKFRNIASVQKLFSKTYYLSFYKVSANTASSVPKISFSESWARKHSVGLAPEKFSCRKFHIASLKRLTPKVSRVPWSWPGVKRLASRAFQSQVTPFRVHLNSGFWDLLQTSFLVRRANHLEWSKLNLKQQYRFPGPESVFQPLDALRDAPASNRTCSPKRNIPWVILA